MSYILPGRRRSTEIAIIYDCNLSATNQIRNPAAIQEPYKKKIKFILQMSARPYNVRFHIISLKEETSRYRRFEKQKICGCTRSENAILDDGEMPQNQTKLEDNINLYNNEMISESSSQDLGYCSNERKSSVSRQTAWKGSNYSLSSPSDEGYHSSEIK